MKQTTLLQPRLNLIAYLGDNPMSLPTKLVDSRLRVVLTDDGGQAITTATITYTLTRPDTTTAQAGSLVHDASSPGTYRAAVDGSVLTKVGTYTITTIVTTPGNGGGTFVSQIYVFGTGS